MMPHSPGFPPTSLVALFQSSFLATLLYPYLNIGDPQDSTRDSLVLFALGDLTDSQSVYYVLYAYDPKYKCQAQFPINFIIFMHVNTC